ncbi:P22 phage major capsid protein family protein [Streptococcus ictaluri]|uniref:P22 coat protein-protein 5 domain protein n=1 Tax=Streptococcus ictaluri 707-05 TaxID=764299 RepID=G5K3R7_9STRE|nr:P22 phage major capsid protein family protein [Streptococcus ictaluri]EHI69718.1 P22 coat protein - protein 5 domain protein [Streptococcus ictaluri 707-05]QBX25535.1 hypothetical protein Javan262_0020 [Streptococcus phage Javan262]
MSIGTDNFKNFIPTLWSARLLASLDKNLVFEQMATTDYEGEIKGYGDAVKINSIGEITIKDYTGADIDNPDELTSTQVVLNIDQAKYFHFQVKDVVKAQANVDLMDKSMERAGYALADHIDQKIAALADDSSIKNKFGETGFPKAITVKNAYDMLVDLSVKLDELNIPKVGRKVVLPSWYIGMLRKDVRFVDNFNVLANGIVEGAMVAGIQLLTSNNIKKSSEEFTTIAGTQNGIAFAKQIVETEAYRPEKNFSDAVKGLLVYGLKVIDPRQVISFCVKQGQEIV